MSTKAKRTSELEGDETSWQYQDMSKKNTSSPHDEMVTSNNNGDEFEDDEEEPQRWQLPEGQRWQGVSLPRKRITLDNNQRKLQKILFNLDLIPALDFDNLTLFSVQLSITTLEQWLDYLDAVTDLRRDNKWSLPNIESTTLYKTFSLAIRGLIHVLNREQLCHMRYYFTCLAQRRDQMKIKRIEGMGREGEQKQFCDDPDNLEALYQRKMPERKQLSLRSWSTLKLDKEPVTFITNSVVNSNYLIDMKIFDLEKIAQENLGTPNMWKDAVVRMKFYGNATTDAEPYQIARNLASRSINIIEMRESEFKQTQVQQQLEKQHKDEHNNAMVNLHTPPRVFYSPSQPKKAKKNTKK